jgi:glycerol kinase
MKNKSEKYILAIDAGTTGTTALLITSKNFQVVGKLGVEFPQIFPKSSWVEHNLLQIMDAIKKSILGLLDKSGVSPTAIECIGITNQRETVCSFNKKGVPLANAIVWQDRRTSDYCQAIKENHGDKSAKSKTIAKKKASAKTKTKAKAKVNSLSTSTSTSKTKTKILDAAAITRKTGLPIDPYFSASKMHWLLENNDKVKSALKSRDLLFGTIDTFITYTFTGQKTYVTDATNASRYLLMNLETGEWDQELCQFFGVPSDLLPKIVDSIGEIGKTQGLGYLPDGIPITAILGDQQSALFGQGGIEKGALKCTYGTGSFLLLNTGTKIVRSKEGLLSTVAHRYKNKTYYALEGSTYIAGAAVQWMRDSLGTIEHSAEIEELALSVTDLELMNDILFFPFFTGIGTPYWNPHAKGAILGLTRGTNKSHIARACLEGITLSVNDLVNAFRNNSPVPITQLNVDGGASSNNLLLSMQANFSQLEIIRPKNIETTAYGVGLAAAIGAGLLKMEKVMDYWQKDAHFEPKAEDAQYFKMKKQKWTSTLEKLYLNN